MVLLLIFIHLKVFVVCVKFCLFTDYDQITFPLQTCQIQNFLTRTLSSSYLYIFTFLLVLQSCFYSLLLCILLPSVNAFYTIHSLIIILSIL